MPQATLLHPLPQWHLLILLQVCSVRQLMISAGLARTPFIVLNSYGGGLREEGRRMQMLLRGKGREPVFTRWRGRRESTAGGAPLCHSAAGRCRHNLDCSIIVRSPMRHYGGVAVAGAVANRFTKIINGPLMACALRYLLPEAGVRYEDNAVLCSTVPG